MFILSEQIEFEDLRTTSQQSVDLQSPTVKIYEYSNTTNAHKNKKHIWNFITH